MSEASEYIADLDDEIARSGQALTLRRIVADGDDLEKPFRGVARGYTPSELPGGLQQGQSLIVLSPTGLPVEFADTNDTRLRRNDDVEFDGRSRSVLSVEPVRVAGTLVRMNVTVEG